MVKEATNVDALKKQSMSRIGGEITWLKERQMCML